MALLPSYTLLGDATPLFSENNPGSTWGTSGWSASVGYQYSTAVVKYSTAQIFVKDVSRKRLSLTNSIRVNRFSDCCDHANVTTYTDCDVLSLMDRNKTGTSMAEGDEEWRGFSWYFPANWNPGTGFGFLSEWASNHAGTHPSYGGSPIGIESLDASQLYIRFKSGLLPSPPSGSYNPILPPSGNGYSTVEPLLGTGAPRPFTKEVWHDFYYYALYRARTNGIFDLWHREEGGAWEKIYSNRADGSALINRAPHPTFIYNTLNGAPGEGGSAHPFMSTMRYYSNKIGTDVIYWHGGDIRRQSEAEILAAFPAGGSVSAPTITGISPSSGPVGTSVTITGTNLTAATSVTFAGFSSSFVINSSTQIVAIAPQAAVSGVITVTTSGGSASSSSFTVTVIPTGFNGNYTDAVQMNCAPVPNPEPIPEINQFLGNWTTAIQVNCSPWTPSPIPPGYTSYGVWWEEGREFLGFAFSETDADALYRRWKQITSGSNEIMTLDIIGLPPFVK